MRQEAPGTRALARVIAQAHRLQIARGASGPSRGTASQRSSLRYEAKVRPSRTPAKVSQALEYQTILRASRMTGIRDFGDGR